MINRGKDCTKFIGVDYSLREIHLWIGGPIPPEAHLFLEAGISSVFNEPIVDVAAAVRCDECPEWNWTFDGRRPKGECLAGLVDHMVERGIEFEISVSFHGKTILQSFRRDFGLLEWETTSYQVPIVRTEEVVEILRKDSATKREIMERLRAILPPELPDLKPVAEA